MRAVLISIQPKWCELIASGRKTIEVRKNKPKLETPFKVYIYQTKSRECNGPTYSDGKVIGEFICDRVISTVAWRLRGETGRCAKRTDNEEQFPTLSCLTIDEIQQYAGGFANIIYGWYISNLVIYEQPKKLCEFEKPWCDTNGNWQDIRPCECGKICEHEYFDYSENTVACAIDYDGANCPYTKMQRPPQSWCYVEEV